MILSALNKMKILKACCVNAKAIGCFYVESPAMRMLLKKLQVDTYLGLVAASSVIRPGVSKSGMMREYILRYRYPERRKDAHPVLLKIMPETYGVMVYQEDVIKVAHHFGGLTLGEADMLRRGMSGKFRSRDEFLKVKQQFFDNCKKAWKTRRCLPKIFGDK
jgi:DNA polymerase III alpha subunit